MERNIRTSAKALVIKDGCLLAVKINDEATPIRMASSGSGDPEITD
ncbi:hypothetical protein [Butyrivibrio sp. AE2032]|nr:hypothetical protein [Butyrivibrio sp. AE2032]